MRIVTKKIKEDNFNLAKEMKRLGYTYRSLGKKMKIDPTYLSRIANGLPITLEKATEIKNRMVEPFTPNRE